MGETITNPDANPILIAILNLFLLGGVGYFVAGQSGKGIAAIVYTLVLGICTLGFGYLIIWVFAIDGYMIGQKLAAGETIGEKENGLSFLDMLPGFK